LAFNINGLTFRVPTPPEKSCIFPSKFKVLESLGNISLKSTHYFIYVVNFDVSGCTKFQIFWGSAPEPAGGAYSPPTGP